MGLFQKATQRITISSDDQEILEEFVLKLKARTIKGAKISAVKRVDGRWHCVVNCMQAGVIYSHEILPLLYDSVETQSFEVLLEFADENERVKKCPTELLVSFDLNSRFAFGDKSENEFIEKIHRNILQSPENKPAAVTYYIISGGAVTICIPCAEPEEMKKQIKHQLQSFGIKRLMIKLIDRRSGEEVS